MNPQQQRVVKLASFALIAIQALSVVFAAFSAREIFKYSSGFGVGAEFAGTMMIAALWPVMMAAVAFYSYKEFVKKSHYGWMGLIAVAVVTLPSFCFPASAVLLYVLLNPSVRAPFMKKVDLEWGLSAPIEQPKAETKD